MIARSFVSTLVLAACVSLFPAAGYAGTVVADFQAVNGLPGTQGWSSETGILSAAIASDGGISALELRGNNCCGYYYHSLTAQQWSDAFSQGWTYSVTLRVPGPSGGVAYAALDTDTTNPRFDIVVGGTGSSGWAGLSAFYDFSNPALQTPVDWSNYHTLVMHYDPITSFATLSVDGTEMLSGYSGHSVSRESHGPFFGMVSGTNNEPAYFTAASFSIGSDAPAPEPATWLLLAGGSLLVAYRKRHPRTLPPAR